MQVDIEDWSSRFKIFGSHISTMRMVYLDVILIFSA